MKTSDPSVHRCRLGPAALTLVMMSSACSDGSTDAISQTPSDDDTNSTMARVEATVLQWQEEIRISYSFTNASGSELIAFDNGYAGAHDVTQAERTDDGVRLFKGRIDTGAITFFEQPTIGGRLTGPAGSLQGTATISFPVPVPSQTPAGPGEALSIDEASFCIGFSLAEEVIDTMIGNDRYPLNQDLDLQRFACTTVARP